MKNLSLLHIITQLRSIMLLNLPYFLLDHPKNFGIQCAFNNLLKKLPVPVSGFQCCAC